MPIFKRILICPLYQGQKIALIYNHILVYHISYDNCKFQNYKNRLSTIRSSKIWVSIKHTYRVQLDFIIKISSGQFFAIFTDQLQNYVKISSKIS